MFHFYIIHCSYHKGQKEFSYNEHSDELRCGKYIKQHCELIIQQAFIVSACV